MAQGNDRGELVVSWLMQIRPEVVATVIDGRSRRQGTPDRHYDTSPGAAHRRCYSDCRAVIESACPRHTLFARRQGHQCRQPRRVRRAALAELLSSATRLQAFRVGSAHADGLRRQGHLRGIAVRPQGFYLAFVVELHVRHEMFGHHLVGRWNVVVPG